MILTVALSVYCPFKTDTFDLTCCKHFVFFKYIYTYYGEQKYDLQSLTFYSLEDSGLSQFIGNRQWVTIACQVGTYFPVIMINRNLKLKKLTLGLLILVIHC